MKDPRFMNKLLKIEFQLVFTVTHSKNANRGIIYMQPIDIYLPVATADVAIRRCFYICMKTTKMQWKQQLIWSPEP